MGADQIGYLFKGPQSLDTSESMIRQATARAKEVRAALWSIAGHDDLPERLPSALGHLTREQVNVYVCITEDLPEPHVAVQNLLEWWRDGARDTCTRTDPDNPDALIGFAGDRSWGDEPDGFGYITFQHALVLDILKFFGIR